MLQNLPPLDNILAERLMAKLDSIVKSSPSMNANSVEIVILYKSNKTSEWLREKVMKIKTT